MIATNTEICLCKIRCFVKTLLLRERKTVGMRNAAWRKKKMPLLRYTQCFFNSFGKGVRNVPLVICLLAIFMNIFDFVCEVSVLLVSQQQPPKDSCDTPLWPRFIPPDGKLSLGGLRHSLEVPASFSAGFLPNEKVQGASGTFFGIKKLCGIDQSNIQPLNFSRLQGIKWNNVFAY